MFKWLAFLSLSLILIIIDLNIFRARKTSFQKNILISGFYIAIAIIFGIWIYFYIGALPATNYLNAYLIEKLLSLDNIFVISLIFTYLKIPPNYQQRVLFWGILSVIVFRAIMISCGILIIEKFEWILYVFGAILIITGVKLLLFINKKTSLKNNYLLYLIKKKINVTSELKGERFVIKKDGKVYLTHLGVALILIEALDLVFAIDSIPAALAITQDSYIIYTSNIFAILGLRSLYFCLSELIQKLRYLKYSLAIILIFIGSKIFLKTIFELSAGDSLIITLLILLPGILLSLKRS